MMLRVLWLLYGLMLAMSSQASPLTIHSQFAYLHSDTPQSITQIQILPESKWTVVPEFSNHGFQSGEYWLRMRLEHTQNSDEMVILRFAYPLHDEVDFYDVKADGSLVNAWFQGDMRDPTTKAVMDKHAAIELTFQANEVKWIYARVQSLNSLALSIDILTPREHQESVHFEGIISSLIYGVLLVMVLYNLGLAVSMKDKAYYSYVAYVITFIAFVLTLSGDGYYYFWNSWPNFNRVLMPILSGILILPSLLFPYYLLNLQQTAPRVAKIYQGFMVLALAFLLSIPVIGTAYAIVAVNSFSAVLSILMLFLGLYLSYKKVPLARMYTFAWIILLVGLSVLSLASLGFMESNLVTRTAGLLGGVIEVTILSLVLAHRITQERKGKMQAIKESMHSRKLIQEVFELAPIGIVRFDINGKLVAMNPNFVRMMGYQDQQQALAEFDMFHNVLTDHQENRLHLMSHDSLIDKEITFRTRNDEYIPCSVSLHMHLGEQEEYIEAYITDIRERLEAQSVRDFMEQERLMSMEQLVTGVAHEINTPLGVNITSTSHIKEILDEVEREMEDRTLTRTRFKEFISDGQQLIDIVNHNLLKISNLVRRFKLVSVADTDKTTMNLRQHLELSLNSHLFIGEDINVALHCDDDINIESYPAAWDIIMEQLLENSIVHGFNATTSKNKSIIINVSYDDDDMWHFDYYDNGQGVKPEIASRIFDPFVTTKRGSSDHAGLGLYRVYNLVSRVLGGSIELGVEPGFHLSITFHAHKYATKQSA